MTATEVVVTNRTAGLQRLDPFQLMDRLDDELIRKELEGIVGDELIYVVKDKGREFEALSKVGTDEACKIMARRGDVVREDPASLRWEVRGEGEEQVALFVISVARFAVGKAEGDTQIQELKLDQAVGTKAQALFYEAREMSLDSNTGIGKHRTKTWRWVLENDRKWLEWVTENAWEDDAKVFATAILAGEEVHIQPGRKPNPFWFEQGTQKAARNARQRLIPAEVKAEVIAYAKEAGGKKIRKIEDGVEQSAKEKGNGGEDATEAQLELLQKLLRTRTLSKEEKQQIENWVVTKHPTKVQMSEAIDKLQAKIKRRKEKRAADVKEDLADKKKRLAGELENMLADERIDAAIREEVESIYEDMCTANWEAVTVDELEGLHTRLRKGRVDGEG